MLLHLSFLNAKKQLADYIIYFVTLLFSIVLLYSFNSVLFSAEMKSIMKTQLSGVRPMIYFVSILIVGILGWLVNYMIKFMLKKRGRELGTYMLLGVSNQQVSRMFILENVFWGFFALSIGIPCGVFFSEIIKAITMVILGYVYLFNLQISFEATLLTIAYIFLIFFIALLLNQRLLKRLNLKELIYIQFTITKVRQSSSLGKIILFLFSILSLCIGIFFLLRLPLQNGYDILLGIICCTLFVFLFFESLSGVILFWIKHHTSWLYKKNNLIIYRTFASKINSLKRTLQTLGILFMIALFSLALATGFSKMAENRQQMIAFDMMILHQGPKETIRDFDSLLVDAVPIENSYSYTIFKNEKKDYVKIRDRENLELAASTLILKENMHDTYMKFSDYQALRKMLHLDPVKMSSNQFIIHCVDYLKPKLSKYSEKHPLRLNNQQLVFSGVQTESFNQYDDYGNGHGFILVVPDSSVTQLSALYSLYAAQFQDSKSINHLERRIKKFSHLSTFSYDENNTNIKNGSRLLTNDDYLFGRKIERESSDGIPMILPMALLGIIFCITGATILAVQILSDQAKNIRQNKLLNYLGEKESERKKIVRNQISLYFLSPLFPALIVGNIINWILLTKASGNSFAEQGMIEVLLIVNFIFLAIYVFYGLIVYRQFIKKID